MIIRNNLTWAILWLSLVCLAACPGNVWGGQNASVVFDCGDIGLEARRVLSNLQKERLQFQKQKKELEKREQELKILQEEVDTQIKQLQELKQQLAAILAEKDEIEKEKVKKLSKIYQKREPAGAARTLASMDKELAVSVLSGMRDKYAGEILDNMDAETAREYSTALGRLQN